MKEEDKEELLKRFLPVLLSGMLRSGEIGPDVDDRSLLEQRQQYLQETDIEVLASIREKVMEAVHRETEAGNCYAASVLAATVVEHAINEFYCHVLREKYGLSNTGIERCLKVDLRDKLTWLFQIVTGEAMEQELTETILKNAQKRNEIVHYKPLRSPEKLVDRQEYEYLKSVDETLERLETVLHRAQVRLLPETEQAQEIIRRVFADLA